MEEGWGAVTPTLDFPLSGMALGLTTYAYCERRREEDHRVIVENLRPMGPSNQPITVPSCPRSPVLQTARRHRIR
jgi:hypothetical protein